MMLLLCSNSHNDVPTAPQRNVSMAAVRGAFDRQNNKMTKRHTDLNKIFRLGRTVRVDTDDEPPNLDLCCLQVYTGENLRHDHVLITVNVFSIKRK